MKKTYISLALLLLTTGTAFAQQQPNYNQARQIWQQIDAVLGQTGRWHKMPLAERNKRLDAAVQLKTKASSLWPGPSRCKEASSFMVDYIQSLNSFALVVEGKRSLDTPSDLYAPMFNAVVFGEKRAACYDEVEALDIPAKK